MLTIRLHRKGISMERITSIKTTNTFATKQHTTRDETAIFYKEINQRFFISTQTFSSLFNVGLIADARCGGLVIGRSHNQGHIPLIRVADEGYEVFANMEGLEFIVNADASIKFADELLNINSQKGALPFGNFDFKETLPRIIDARAQTTKMVLTDGSQMIVNRLATQRNIERLIEINESFNPFTIADPFHFITSII